MKVFQIYFKPEQLPLLDYLPLYNYNPTLFFESSVILDLVRNGHHLDTDYFGVVSYKLREKIGIMQNNWRSHPNIANHSVQTFTPEQFKDELYKGLPDAMSFQCHSPHDPVLEAVKYHSKFADLWLEIMTKIGYNWKPTRIQNIFYCNFFVAKSQIYERFVKEMLGPAIMVMNEMPGLMADSGYRSSPFPKELQYKFGIQHWPYHAFICERMFSYFAHIHNLKCLHY